ncbi:type II toxin-antitoxin system VapC family toxin [soil metagenome]
MLVDANLLLYARDTASSFHAKARDWLTASLNGSVRVGLPWQSLVAFLRISTHPRASERPLGLEEAWRQVEAWLSAPSAWIPRPTERHADVFGRLLAVHELRGNLVTDAHLAALAIEHGIAVCSADTDFARFSELRWVNPLAR